MTASTTDPEFHRDAERDLFRHVEALIAGEMSGRDRQLVVDTRRGLLPASNLRRDVARSDQALEIKRLMVELDKPDHALQRSLPTGPVVDVSLGGRSFFLFNSRVGHVRFVGLPPARELVAGVEPAPLTPAELRRRLADVPPPVGGTRGPVTTVVLSTAGFDSEARQAVRRDNDGALVLVEPDGVGGWRVTTPRGLDHLSKALNPEAEADKRRRVRAALEDKQLDLLAGGVSLEKVAGEMNVPVKQVQAEAKALARERADLRVKVLDGTPVLYREGTGVLPPEERKGSGLAMMDSLKGLFARSTPVEKKVAVLSEKRAALAQQRDRQYDEIGVLEQQEQKLRDDFKESDNPVVKRRLTSQLLQLQKDIARKQQLTTVLNQQVNTVGTHLHNLELVKQGQTASLPDADELAEDAAAAEEVLADLQANSELADAVGGVTASGLSDEEQALYDELEAASNPPLDQADTAADPAAQPSTPQREPTTATPTPTAPATPRRTEPEVG